MAAITQKKPLFSPADFDFLYGRAYVYQRIDPWTKRRTGRREYSTKDPVHITFGPVRPVLHRLLIKPGASSGAFYTRDIEKLENVRKHWTTLLLHEGMDWLREEGDQIVKRLNESQQRPYKECEGLKQDNLCLHFCSLPLTKALALVERTLKKHDRPLEEITFRPSPTERGSCERFIIARQELTRAVDIETHLQGSAVYDQRKRLENRPPAFTLR